MQSVAICCLVEGYEENIALHKYVVRKGNGISVAFPDNCGYFSLILNPNLTSAGYLKVSWNVEIEVVIFFHVFCYIKIH